MGIKDVWTILQPFCERKPLYELQGKTVAIDLSGWVCEAQNVTEYYIQPKMYLRNLYFRTCYLLLMDVNLVFVLDGKAPELKYDTIAARNEIQFKGAKPKAKTTKVGKDRTRFNHVLLKCKEMLALIGLACLTGKGEAEALCAHLNEDGLVDGCISQDSDCFAYGAKIVYRNFSISQQGAHSASGGSVDVYNIEQAYRSINFGRNKIIALALLCGSDYSDGIYGVGREACLKLFEGIDDKDILERIHSWRTNISFFEKYNFILSDKKLCSSCGHTGKIGTHTKLGCSECKTSKGCDTKYKEKLSAIKNEVGMRNKSIADANFPNQNIIDEFSIRKDKVLKVNLKWKQPDLIGFVKFVTKHLQWEEIYGFQKLFPILTRWQLLHFKELEYTPVIPDRIKKCRNQKGVASFEIIWKDTHNHYTNLIPESQLKTVDIIKLWSTIEPRNLVLNSYPDLVQDFEQSKIKPKKTKRKLKPINDVDKIENLLANTSISEPKPKRKTKQNKDTKVNTIDTFFKTVAPCDIETKELDLSDGNLEMSNFGDENDLDLSNIIEDIVNRTLPTYITDNLNKLKECSFFSNDIEENDLFEKSMHIVTSSDIDSDNDLNDTFDNFINHIPLNQRFKCDI